jgi:adenylate cyclase
MFLVHPAFVDGLDLRVCDVLTRLAGPGRESGRVVIVGIDEKSLDQFGRWAWPRGRVAQLSRSILDQGAVTVALDMKLKDLSPRQRHQAAISI